MLRGDNDKNVGNNYYGPNISLDSDESDVGMDVELPQNTENITNSANIDVETDDLGEALIREVTHLISASEEAD